MGRPERPLIRDGSPARELAASLRELRDRSGLTYDQLARRAKFSRSTLQEALAGRRLPTLQVVEAVARACGDEPERWRSRWLRAQAAEVHRTRYGGSSDQVMGIDAESSSLPQRDAVDPDRSDAERAPASPLGVEVLLSLWREQRAQARQSENQRAVMTIVVVALSAGVLGLLHWQHWGAITVVLTLVPVLLGTFGAMACAKYYERFQMHMTEAQILRKRLDEAHPRLRLENDWTAARSEHSQRYRWLYQLRLHHLWVGLHIGIAIVGLALTIAELAA
jgi:transcriptional regulator with XRE-family HTH domain